jgi:tetratricopeptide (TPR) repeat protein
MDHVIKNRSAKVLLVEPMDARRNMIRTSLKTLGFKDVIQLKSLGDVIRYLETEGPADWIITSIFPADANNGLSFLGLCTRNQNLRSIRVSFLHKFEEHEFLPHAFELGLFSAHPFASDTTSQMQEIDKVFEAGANYHWHDPLIAASFLRTYLTETKQFDDLIQMEKSLISIFHDVPSLIVDLASALHRQGRNQAALLTLSRALELSGQVAQDAELLHNKIVSETKGDRKDPSLAELYGLSAMVVIDPDQHVINHLEQVSKMLGFITFYGFTDGLEAWKFLQERKVAPDLLIMEWRIPGLSGSQLVQRLRTEGSEPFSLIVYSSLVKTTSDKILLREMGVSEVIEKPIDHKKLKQILETIMIEDKNPKETKSAERLVRQHLRANKHSAARLLFDETMKKGGFAEQVRLEIEAMFAFYQGKFELASRHAVEALHIGGQTLTLLNLLGKIYMKLRRFQDANRFFNKAKEISPHNIERLTMMAESHVEQGQNDAANQQLEAAKIIDAENTMVVESDAKIALSSGDHKRVESIVKANENIDSIVSFMNNRAIALVNEEQYKEAIDLYITALKSLGKKMHLQSVIFYNMSLAYIKQGDLKKAAIALKSASGDENSTVFRKAASLFERTYIALKENKPLVLKQTSNSELAIEAAEEEEEEVTTLPILPTATGIKRGDMRLHLVFQSSNQLSASSAMMIQTIPRFRG